MGELLINDTIERDRLMNAENTVAGSILIDERSYDVIADKVRPEDFASEQCAMILRAAGELKRSGRPADPLLIKEWAREQGVGLDNLFMMQLMEITPTAANVEHYAAIVREQGRRRAVKSLAKTILEDEDSDAAKLLHRLADGTEQVLKGESRGLLNADAMMTRFFNDLEQRRQGIVNTVATGYPLLDKLLGRGMQRGGLYILAARPGMGKSTLAVNIADRAPGDVLYISMEMNDTKLSSMLLGMRSGISAGRLLNADNLTQAEYDAICLNAAQISGGHITVNEDMYITIPEIGIKARSMPGLKLIVIDHLGLIAPEDRKGSLYEITSRHTAELKRLAMALNVPILCLCQLNRAAEGRDDHRPRLSDLRDSGSIEQDADGVLLLYRDDYYKPAQQRQSVSEIEVEVAKNRHGMTGRVRLMADLRLARVENVGE